MEKKTVSRGHMRRAHGTFYETCAKVRSCAHHAIVFYVRSFRTKYKKVTQVKNEDPTAF